jgi:hypothetical protein
MQKYKGKDGKGPGKGPGSDIKVELGKAGAGPTPQLHPPTPAPVPAPEKHPMLTVVRKPDDAATVSTTAATVGGPQEVPPEAIRTVPPQARKPAVATPAPAAPTSAPAPEAAEPPSLADAWDEESPAGDGKEPGEQALLYVSPTPSHGVAPGAPAGKTQDPFSDIGQPTPAPVPVRQRQGQAPDEPLASIEVDATELAGGPHEDPSQFAVLPPARDDTINEGVPAHGQAEPAHDGAPQEEEAAGSGGGEAATPPIWKRKGPSQNKSTRVILAGVIGFVIGALAMCGVKKENKCPECQDCSPKPQAQAPKPPAPKPAPAPAVVEQKAEAPALSLAAAMDAAKRKKPRAPKEPKTEEPKVSAKCSMKSAAQSSPSEVPSSIKRKVQTGVGVLRTQLSGKTPEVTLLFCPNADGSQGGTVTIVKVDGAGELNGQVKANVEAQFAGGKASEPGLSLSQPRYYKQSVPMD